MDICVVNLNMIVQYYVVLFLFHKTSLPFEFKATK